MIKKYGNLKKMIKRKIQEKKWSKFRFFAFFFAFFCFFSRCFLLFFAFVLFFLIVGGKKWSKVLIVWIKKWSKFDILRKKNDEFDHFYNQMRTLYLYPPIYCTILTLMKYRLYCFSYRCPHVSRPQQQKKPQKIEWCVWWVVTKLRCDFELSNHFQIFFR